jgi:transposase
MGMSSQRFAPEFKDEAVRQIIERGHPVSEVAQRLGVSAHSLYKWVKAVKPDKTEQHASELVEAKGEILKWYAESFSDAQGPATRFQWGANYAGGLLRLQPDDAVRIRDVTAQVLGEHEGPDRVYQRAHMRLERLDLALRKWNTDTKGAHHSVLVGLHERMQ